MRKKLLVALTVATFAFSAMACGGSDKKTTTDTPKTETSDTTKTDTTKTDTTTPSDTEVSDTQVSDTEVSDTTASTGGWSQYADVFTETYMGMTEADEAVVFLISDDETTGVISFTNSDAETASFVGNITDNGDGTMTIDDDASQTQITFGVTDNGDDTYTLDIGDAGTATVEACTQDEAFEALDTIDAYTTTVNPGTDDSSDAETTSTGSWSDYSDIFTETYMGVTEADEAVVFLISDDGKMGVIAFMNEDAEVASFVGEVTDNGDGTMTIADDASQTQITFGVTDNGDDTYTLDIGDAGTATVGVCTQDEAFEALDTIGAIATPVN